MRVRNAHRRSEESPQLQMSSMIDVVFLLLIFFVMTFQITAAEGDIEIDAAQAGGNDAGEDPPRQILFRIQLAADEQGGLAHVRFDSRTLKSLDDLQWTLREIVQHGESDRYAVQLHSDRQLEYRHVMDAITAIRGSDPQTPLIEDIQFIHSS